VDRAVNVRVSVLLDKDLGRVLVQHRADVGDRFVQILALPRNSCLVHVHRLHVFIVLEIVVRRSLDRKRDFKPALEQALVREEWLGARVVLLQPFLPQGQGLLLELGANACRARP